MNKTSLRIALGIIGVVTALYLAATTFAATEIRFQCSGEISNSDTVQPLTVYIKLMEYSPWIFWSDSNSNGNMTLEVPNVWMDYFSHVEKVGDQFQIYDASPPQGTLKGNFSSLSNVLAMQLAVPPGFFDGKCVPN